MAAKPKKTVSKRATGVKAGAAPAVAERTKDAGKASFGKAAPKTVKPATAAKPTKAGKAAGDKPSMATRMMRKVKATASGAVGMAASVVGKGSNKAKAK